MVAVVVSVVAVVICVVLAAIREVAVVAS